MRPPRMSRMRFPSTSSFDTSSAHIAVVVELANARLLGWVGKAESSVEDLSVVTVASEPSEISRGIPPPPRASGAFAPQSGLHERSH